MSKRKTRQWFWGRYSKQNFKPLIKKTISVNHYISTIIDDYYILIQSLVLVLHITILNNNCVV